MKQPLGIAALLYISGLLIADCAPLPLPLLFGISIMVAVMAVCVAQWRGVLLWPLLVLAGWTNLAFHTAIVSPNDLRTVLNGDFEEVTVRGVLAETPEARPTPDDLDQTARTLALLDATSLRRNRGDWQPAHGRIAVITRGAVGSEYFAGQRVEVSGVISHPPLPVVEGLFNYRNYLRRQGIDFQLRSGSESEWQLLEPRLSKPPRSERFTRWAQTTLSRGLPEQDESLRLLWAMTLGWRNALPGEVYEPFIQSGTVHIFAISGLHIALIAGILVAVLRVAQVSRLWCGLLVIPMIWFYAGATGWQPSAVRATIMMTLIVGGWSLKRPVNLLNSLAAAALAILLWEPQQLFQAGFQLSFFVVLCIALLLPPLETLRDRLLRSDPLRPVELLPPWQRLMRPTLRWVLTSAAVSLAAWLGSWPLTAYYFNISSPVTLLANLIIVPLASAALASSLGSLVFGAWLPWVSELFNHSAWFWMSCMAGVSRWSAGLPEAFFYVPPPLPVDFVIYYASVIVVLSGVLMSPRARPWLVAGALLAVGYYVSRWFDARQSVQITAIPLEGGCAIFCDAPGRGNDLLVNCGNTNPVKRVLQPWLKTQGVNSLSGLMLTHGDLRHIGGTAPLCDVFPVREIFVPNVQFRSPTYRRLVQQPPGASGQTRVLRRGDTVAGWSVLHPMEMDAFPQADDNAVVLLGDFRGTRILLLSDLGRPGQNILMEREPNLRADIVIAGLPEKGEPIHDALLERIQPSLIVIVDSEWPATKRANTRLVERLQSRAAPVLFTRKTGGVTLNLTKRGWQLRTADGRMFSPETIPAETVALAVTETDEDQDDWPDER